MDGLGKSLEVEAPLRDFRDIIDHSSHVFEGSKCRLSGIEGHAAEPIIRI